MPPNVYVYSDLEEMFKDTHESALARAFMRNKNKIQTSEDLFNAMMIENKCLILSEPGYGKTRLLEEFHNQLSQLGKLSVNILLKHFSRGRRSRVASGSQHIFLGHFVVPLVQHNFRLSRLSKGHSKICHVGTRLGNSVSRT